MQKTDSQAKARAVQISVSLAPGYWLLPCVMLGGALWALLIAALLG